MDASNKCRVSVMFAGSTSQITDEINTFLLQNHDQIWVLDIKFNAEPLGYSAMVIYEYR